MAALTVGVDHYLDSLPQKGDWLVVRQDSQQVSPKGQSLHFVKKKLALLEAPATVTRSAAPRGLIKYGFFSRPHYLVDTGA